MHWGRLSVLLSAVGTGSGTLITLAVVCQVIKRAAPFAVLIIRGVGPHMTGSTPLELGGHSLPRLVENNWCTWETQICFWEVAVEVVSNLHSDHGEKLSSCL